MENRCNRWTFRALKVNPFTGSRQSTRLLIFQWHSCNLALEQPSKRLLLVSSPLTGWSISSRHHFCRLWVIQLQSECWNSMKISYKISELFKLNQICTQSGLQSAASTVKFLSNYLKLKDWKQPSSWNTPYEIKWDNFTFNSISI